MYPDDAVICGPMGRVTATEELTPPPPTNTTISSAHAGQECII